MKVNVPISLGELFDKISILEIKNKKILSDSKILNINKELNGLKKVIDELNINLSETNNLYNKLYKINLKLWEIEDSIRVLEKNKDFGEKFIELTTKDLKLKMISINFLTLNMLKKNLTKTTNVILIESSCFFYMGLCPYNMVSIRNFESGIKVFSKNKKRKRCIIFIFYIWKQSGF